jgi:ATP-binding cassette, subfamily B, multidrug efflux pump
MARLWKFFGRFLRHKRPLFLGFLTIPIAALLDVRITVMIGEALDRMRGASDTEFLAGLFWMVLLIALVRGVFRFLQRWWLVCVSRYVEVDLKQDLFDQLTRLSFSFHDKSLSGDIASRLTSDVENIRMFLGPGLMYVAGALVMVPAALFTLIGLSPWLTLSMLLPMLAMGLGIQLLTPRLHRHSTAVQEKQAEISHIAQESFGGIRVVKGYGLEESRARRLERASAENLGHQLGFARARGLSHAITETSHALTFLPILLVGGLALIDRTLEVGALFQFIDLTFKVFWPVIALGWMAGLYPRALSSARRIDELLGEQPEIRDPEPPVALPRIQGALRFEQVEFRYPSATTPALADIEIGVAPGAMLGVVGPTGSGKSTLLGLIGRLHDPTAGAVTLDGVDVRRLELATLRRALGYVPQDSFLFSETYRDNVQFGSPEPLSDARVLELVATAGMEQEVARFPAGLDQLIGERGVTLSGGQRQRTCIARALAREPRVLVLDDCLSAVDTETEARLLENLRRAGSGRTLVVAAHRLSTVKHADEIVVIERGRISARGTHAQLLRSSDWYRETWRIQQAREELLAS